MKDIHVLTLNEKNITDFAKARNRLLDHSRSRWVLFLDTDEELTNALMKEIEALDPKGFDGFYIRRKIFFLGKYIGEDKVLRLGKKDAGKWVRRVHETWMIRGKVGTLGNYIIHNTAISLNSYLKKINLYSSVHASENLKEGKHSNIFKIIVFPKLKFIQNLLAGRGVVFSIYQSFHSFLGWAKQWELQKD